MKITEHEIRGLLGGKCLPGDMRLKEDLPSYLVRKFDELQQKLDAANEKLSRYSMSAGQADQFASEAKSVRKALGFAEDAQDVAPIDLLEKIARLRADAVIEASAYLADIAEGKSAHTAELIKSCGRAVFAYAAQLRSGTHENADKAG